MSEQKAKAWRVVWSRLPEAAGVYIADTPGKARAKSMRAAEEVGYAPKWGEMRVGRAREYDEWAGRQPERLRGVGEEFLRMAAGAS